MRKIIFRNNILFFPFPFEYIQLVLGALIIAVSFNLFLGPNQIASGGVVGASIIVEHLFGIEPAVTQWSINIPLFFIALFILGKKFVYFTVILV